MGGIAPKDYLRLLVSIQKLVKCFFYRCCWRVIYDLQFCYSSKLANGIGIKIRSWSDWLERLPPRSLNHHVLQDTSNTCSTGSSVSACMLSIYVWKTESVQHLETVKTSAIVLDDTYAYSSLSVWFKPTQGLGKFSIYKWQAFYGLLPACVSFHVSILWHLMWFSSSHYLTIWLLRLSAHCCFIPGTW